MAEEAKGMSVTLPSGAYIAFILFCVAVGGYFLFQKYIVNEDFLYILDTEEDSEKILDTEQSL